MDVFWSWPPVTRTITVAALVTSILVHGGLLSLAYVAFLPYRILRFPPEIWRLVSAFLVTGPKFAVIMDPYFIFTYGSALERNSPRFSERGSFFIYVCFVSAVITGLAGFYLGAYTHLDALILAFTYTFAQDNPTTNVTVFILTFPAKYLPYALLLLTFIMAPGRVMQQATGLLAAHLYDFLTRIWPTFGGGTNYIVTPEIVKKWFGGLDRAPQDRGYGTAQDFRREGAAAAASNAWSNQRGPGRRLGE
ncbi:DER1-domain-containing protein [Aulographum hederae CBS 113979]|uniref:Derlin n=1 Tax=Aulographum hederae CBS 113979 TaxID=1176131 RepID=A0A6G1GK81_9PEZI|nr:DER1-domain-containing protein [Aulographum hederae CBS 113979]